MYLQKLREKNIPADAGHFSSQEIDSTDFKNDNLTAKIRRNKAQKLQKILKQKKPSNKISTSKTIGQRNKSNK